MKLILVRHGEVLDKYDPNLTKIGRVQAEKLANRLKKEKIDAIYSSDLKRCKQTANKIGKIGNQKVNFTSILREIPDEIVAEKRKNWKGSKYNLGRIKKLKKFLDELNKKHKDETVLIVGHGKLNKLIVGVLNKINPYDIRFFMQKHCNITIIEYGEMRLAPGKVIYGWKIKIWNDLSHIPSNLRTGRNRIK